MPPSRVLGRAGRMSVAKNPDALPAVDLVSRLGDSLGFDAIEPGLSPNGTYFRFFEPRSGGRR